jgi:uncharacterized protein YjbI with pentapeptide repeats
MASEEQLALVRTGSRRWNEWRRANPGAAIDLSDAYLSNLFLPEINFDRADLARVDLSGANLSGASLRRALLTGADLLKANLSKASLDGADLTDARAVAANLFAATLTRASLQRADLTEATLFGAELSHADLSGADLRWSELSAADLEEALLVEANLLEANLSKANLSRTSLRRTILGEANLRRADLSDADLRGADLRGADLRGADLSGADLSGADLSYSICAGSNFSRASLTGCRIYAMCSWDMTADDVVQKSLCITLRDEPEIVVDELQVAQFIALWIAGGTLPSVITAESTRLVLIVGRFTGERKALFEALADDLRSRGYQPLYQELDPRQGRSDQMEVFGKLARLCGLVLADLSGAGDLWRLLTASMPALPSVICQPLIQAEEPGSIDDTRTGPGLLSLHTYRDVDGLLRAARAVSEIHMRDKQPGEA